MNQNPLFPPLFVAEYNRQRDISSLLTSAIEQFSISCTFFSSDQNIRCACISAKSLRLRLTLRSPLDCSIPGSSVHGILQTRILEWVAMPSSRGSSQPRDGTCVSLSPALAGGFFTISVNWEAHFTNYNHLNVIIK